MARQVSTEGSSGFCTRGEGHNEALDNLRCRQDCSGSCHKTEETYTRYLKDGVCKIGRYSSGNGINPPGSLLPL